MADHLTKVPGVTLRSAQAEDKEFLLEVYSGTREEELRLVPWTDAERSQFLRFQFDAQDAYYHQVYPDARFLVIENEAGPIGRVSLAELPDEIRIIDLALLPGQRGRGIGTRLLAAVLAEASDRGLPVRLHVDVGSPARRLYERLGFAVIEVGEVRLLMERPVELRTAG